MRRRRPLQPQQDLTPSLDGGGNDGGAGRSGWFLKAIVEEVISNPLDFFSRFAKDESGNDTDITIEAHELGVPIEGVRTKFANSSIVPFVVQNSVAVRFVETIKNGGGGKAYICLPFFPQHLSLPIKPGEYVWVYKVGNNEFYWMCRLSTIRQVEDVNFTHLPRGFNLESNHKKMKDESFFYGFESTNGAAAPPGNFFHKIAQNSIAYREEFTGEVVPRMAKDCGDLLLQGSNNAHILLGKEKFEEVSTTVLPEEMTPLTNTDVNENRKPLSPAIDICVLRKARELFDLQDEILADKEAATVETKVNEGHAGLGSGLSAAANIGPEERAGLKYFELEKGRDSLDPSLNKDIFDQEFIDSDIYNCIARIYMTNAKTIDDLLFIPSLEGENSSAPQDVLGLGNYGAMVALGANTRLIGTETIKIQNIVGSSGIQFTPQGDVIIHANREGGAKIVLDAEGNIRIIPGEEGIVFIGGDDADTVPIGGLNTTDSSAPAGSVTYQPITTTAAGLLATEPSDVARQQPPIPGLTSYASKVVIK